MGPPTYCGPGVVEGAVGVIESLGVPGSSGIGDTTVGSRRPSWWFGASASEECGGGAMEGREKQRSASSG
jgi:hypothetical protein